MDRKNGFTITNRDHVLRAWQNTTELVRDYQAYAREMEDNDGTLSQLFAQLAEEEAVHAEKLLQILRGYERETERDA